MATVDHKMVTAILVSCFHLYKERGSPLRMYFFNVHKNMAILFSEICFEKLQNILWAWSCAKKYDFENKESFLPGHPNV